MSAATLLLTLGGLFLLGLCADLLGRRTMLPRVTLLIVGGLAVGPAGMDWIPAELVIEWFPLLTHVALGMVGFLLGEQLNLQAMRRQGVTVNLLAVGKVLGAATAVALLASQRFPEHAEQLLTVALASPVAFELGGPILTRWCLAREPAVHKPIPKHP